MSKEMIISVNGREKKIAIIEDGNVTEFYIERGEDNSGVVGNIYKGRVQRVLPGMQSAFVDIGLERDGFLYVSDFFDEEEEIERIVMEKSKDKKSADEVERETTDELHKKRLRRDKKIDDVQEKAEIHTVPDDSDEADAEKPRNDRKKPPLKKRGRPSKRDNDTRDENVRKRDDRKENVRKENDRKENDRKENDRKENDRKENDRKENNAPEKSEKSKKRQSSKRSKSEDSRKPSENKRKPRVEERERENVLDVSDLKFEESGFERIVDEDADTGEMLKDAIMQEAITDKVRSIEFDMESVDSAEVGSLIDSVSNTATGFERIADEDEEIETKPKSKRASSKTPASRSRASKRKPAAKKPSVNEPGGTTTAAKKRSTRSKSKTKKPAAKKPSTRAKRTPDQDVLENAEASVKETPEGSEMAVRRGSRGGRRRAPKKPVESPSPETESSDHNDKGYKVTRDSEPVVAENQIAEAEFKPKAKGNGRRRRRNDRNQPKITDLLKEGQEILVQIAKEPIARKGARITSHIALPGRYLVYMPTIDHLGVSRKIASSKERSRLRTLLTNVVKNNKIPTGGFIVRTAGTGKNEQELADDANYLVKTWRENKRAAEKAKSPKLIHQDLDIILRLLRDHLSDDFTAIRVDSEEEYLRIVEFVDRIQPKLVKRVKFHTLDEPILDSFGVSDEIDKALKHRVWLKSGGYLVINQTEALIAIDVNTGKFVGKGNARLEDTITKTNMEAVEEISRQIRLRDLGGIIVLDLIDMEDRRNRNKVQQKLQEHLVKDKSPTKVLSFNDFGLIIMTRKRVKQSLERTLCSPCRYCEGAGWVKSAQTICYEILDEARRLSKQLDDVRQTTLRVHPEVAKILRKSEKEVFEEIEEHLGIVDITGDPSVHQEQFDFAFV